MSLNDCLMILTGHSKCDNNLIVCGGEGNLLIPLFSFWPLYSYKDKACLREN